MEYNCCTEEYKSDKNRGMNRRRGEEKMGRRGEGEKGRRGEEENW